MTTSATVDMVPAAVRSMAAAIEVGKDVGERLLSDPKMRNVWQTLRKQAKKTHDGRAMADRLADLPSSLRLEDASSLGVSLPDQACAAFYALVVTELGIPKRAATRSNIAAMAEPWHSAAELCKAAIHLPGRPGREPELARALETAAAYLDKSGRYIKEQSQKESPYTIKRSSRARGDDTTRGRVRALAMGAKAIFGSYEYGSVATVASVALQTNVSAKSVENWCEDLPSQ